MLPQFQTPAEEIAYWQGRHEEATDSLQHERARVERILIAAVTWVERTQEPIPEE